MLRVGLTGGIGAGKSAVSRLLSSYGAQIVDADLLAREVVRPGTPGLAEVQSEFGPDVIGRAGALDRSALGRLVFGAPQRLARLNAILHPRIAVLTAEAMAAAEASGTAVVVHDVALLAETGQAPTYHLVVVVRSPEADRFARLVGQRAMAPDEARQRVAAQVGEEERLALADAVVDNGGSLDDLRQHVQSLWEGRLAPYAANLRAGRPPRRRPLAVVAPDARWAAAGQRLTARLAHLCGGRAAAVQHVGATSTPGLAAQDVIDLQVEVATWSDVKALDPVLAAAGFPRPTGELGDQVAAQTDRDPPRGRRSLHQSVDPGRAADVHLEVAGGSARPPVT